MKTTMHFAGVVFALLFCAAVNLATTGEYLQAAGLMGLSLFELRVALQTWMMLREVEAMKHMEQHLAAAVKALNEAIRKEMK